MIGKLLVAAVLGASLLFAQGSWLKDRKDLIIRPPTRIEVKESPDPPKPHTGRCSIPLLNVGPPKNYRGVMPMIETDKFPVAKEFYVQAPAPPCDEEDMKSEAEGRK